MYIYIYTYITKDSKEKHVKDIKIFLKKKKTKIIRFMEKLPKLFMSLRIF